MRLIVINAGRDASLERLRRSNVGKVLARPTVAGLPLPQGGRRVLPRELLSADVITQLEYLTSIGNVTVVEVGTKGVVNFADIRTRLGIAPRVTTAEVALDCIREEFNRPSVLESLRVPEEELSAGVSLEVQAEPVLESAVTSAEELRDAASVTVTPIDAFLDTPPAPPPPAPTASAEQWVTPEGLSELIRISKNGTLAGVLALFGKPSAGKNKLTLVAEVHACFEGNPERPQEPDPVVALRAVELLRAAQE